MALRKFDPYEYTSQQELEEKDVQVQNAQLYRTYLAEENEEEQVKEVLFFVGIAAFCVFTVLFSFVFLSMDISAFWSFAFAIIGSLTLLQGYKMINQYRKGMKKEESQH